MSHSTPNEPQVLNIAAYKFITLNDLPVWREQLRALAAQNALKGTILLALEGINMFMAGSHTQIAAFLSALRGHTEFANLEVKESLSATQPFNRLLVKIKKEIISLGRPDVDPALQPAPRLSAQKLKTWLDAGQPVLLLDTRNTYEVAAGTFHGALNLGLDNFRSFASRETEISARVHAELAAQNLPADTPIVSFCTGGIRCEKAAPLMQKNGFQNVYQLDGGILKYFEECGHAHYDGDCYVFDQRRAVDAALAPTELTDFLPGPIPKNP
jgi:UPF0176 protein